MAVSEGSGPGRASHKGGWRMQFRGLEAASALLSESAPSRGSSFFRDPDAFELLRAAVFDRLLERHAARSEIRVWVPCCATGEEVYSLAIALLEFLWDVRATNLPLKLFGTDPSLLSLQRARAALYPLDIEAHVSRARLQRFFTKSGEGYQLAKEVRERCIFGLHDILLDPPFSRIDLVSGRNLKSHLGAEPNSQTLSVLHYALSSPGFLLLGDENPDRDCLGFTAIDEKHRLYERTPHARVGFDFGDARDRTTRASRAAGGHATLELTQMHQLDDELAAALQTRNEELRTLNDEATARTMESARLNDDLSNVLVSVAIPIVILDRSSRIRRFTAAAARLFHLLRTDVGRRIGEIDPAFPIADLPHMLTRVLERQLPVERTIRDDEGHWYQLVIRPYLTTENRVDGTTLVAFDIDALKKTQRELTSARTYAESVLDTVRECLLVVDRDLRIRSGNRAFYRTFALSASEAEGQPFALPSLIESGAQSLASRLFSLSEGGSFQGMRETLLIPRRGERIFSLSGRHIDDSPWFLIALDDVTEQVEAERVKHEYQERLRQLAFEQAVAQERERRRIAIDLHDRIGQSLALAQIKLTGILEELSGAQRAAVESSVKLLAQSVLDTRSLTFELSPPVLYDLGMKEALAWLAEQIEEQHGVRVVVSDEGVGAPFEAATMGMLFRAVRELLLNVVKHAQAATAKVTLRGEQGNFEISVEDPGIGFDPAFPTAARSYGLFSVREQIARLGGSLLVDSAPQKGTRVTLRIPFRANTDTEPPPSGAKP